MESTSQSQKKYINILKRENRTLKKHADTPKVDLMENDDNYILFIEIPGRLPSCVEFELIDNQNLFIFYDKIPKYIESKHKIIYKEIRYGKIKRKVKLPSIVNNIYKRENLEDSIISLVFDKKKPELNKVNELSNTLEKLNWADY